MLILIVHLLAGALCLGWYGLIIHKIIPARGEGSVLTGPFGRAIAFIPAAFFGFWYLSNMVVTGWGTAAFLIGAFGTNELLRRHFAPKPASDESTENN